MKLSREKLRRMILSEARELLENSPEYMAMSNPGVDLGGSEELEFDTVGVPEEQEASLADLGQRVAFNLKSAQDDLRLVVDDLERMSRHPEAQKVGPDGDMSFEMKFNNDHAAISMALSALEDAIGSME